MAQQGGSKKNQSTSRWYEGGKDITKEINGNKILKAAAEKRLAAARKTADSIDKGFAAKRAAIAMKLKKKS